jgi:hypothetical protein
MPEVMQRAKDLMKTTDGQLPPGLMPRWLRNKTNMAISRGMTTPVSPRVK